jgi:hypothetical protein
MRCLIASFVLTLAAAASAQEEAPAPKPAAPPMPPAAAPAEANPADRSFEREAKVGDRTVPIKDSVARGLEYLAGSQIGAPKKPGDPWEDVPNRGAFGRGAYGAHVGITALACLAFMSEGNLPGRGKYGRHVEEGLRFVINNCQRSGLISAPGTSHGPMYGHGFATLFLAEVYGMTGRKDITEELFAAVQLIIRCQGPDGGWRYQPRPTEGDTSVTICQIMALRAARNAGLTVPPTTIDRAVAYVKRSQNADGGFRYTLASSGSAFPRSAAAVVTLYTAGDDRVKQDDPSIKNGLEYLLKNPPGKGMDYGHYFYGHYYAAQAMFMAGGDYWRAWFPQIAADLIGKQGEDGSWQSEAGPDYGTAMALIVLQLPNRYLPIFQK